jgi:signal transduction histidine kinase
VASLRESHELRGITDVVLSHLELDELLLALLQRVREILNADTAAILLLDAERGELVARSAVGLEEEVERGVRIPLGRGFAGRVAAGREPVVLEDVDHADVLNPLLREKGIKSMLGVPLLALGEAIGVLHVGTLTPRQFNAADIELLQLVADRASIGIEHARLFQAERRARRRLEHVQSVTEVALEHLDLDALLGELLQRVRTILEADTAVVLLLDEKREELVARAALGLEEEVEHGIRVPLAKGFAGRVAAERRTIALDDVDTADVVNPFFRKRGVKSLLGAPLIAHGRVLGVIHVGTLTPRRFSKDDAELLQLVAERAALGIEKARVHDAIVHLDQLKLAFVAVASHELRTPATSVYGIVATLRERGDQLAPEVRAELDETLWTQSVRLRRLIEQLLDLSKLDARAVRIERQQVALRPLVDDVVDGLGGKDQIRVDVAEDVDLSGDPNALERILTNLLSNAVRHGRPPVVVSADATDHQLRIAVDDAGEGIPHDLAPRMFERFERGGVTPGAGLGLAIAKAYAVAHGGDLRYRRSDLGGARFELVLPRA